MLLVLSHPSAIVTTASLFHHIVNSLLAPRSTFTENRCLRAIATAPHSTRSTPLDSSNRRTAATIGCRLRSFAAHMCHLFVYPSHTLCARITVCRSRHRFAFGVSFDDHCRLLGRCVRLMLLLLPIGASFVVNSSLNSSSTSSSSTSCPRHRGLHLISQKRPTNNGERRVRSCVVGHHPSIIIALERHHAHHSAFRCRRRRTTTLHRLCEVSSLCCSPAGKLRRLSPRSAPPTPGTCGELHRQLPPTIAPPLPSI